MYVYVTFDDSGLRREYDLTTAEGVVALMESSETAEEWGDNCDAVKRANSGYPSFWWQEVVQSGVADKTLEKWGQSTEIKITTF